MLEVDIPGFGQVNLKHLASDFTGTLSMHGGLAPPLPFFTRLCRGGRFRQPLRWNAR